MEAIILFVAISVIILLSLHFLDKYYGKSGLVLLGSLIIIISNIIVLKRFPIMDKSLTMSVFTYPFIFIIGSYAYNKYGAKEAGKISMLSIISNVLFILIVTLCTFAKPAPGNEMNAVDLGFKIMDDKNHLVPGALFVTLVGLVTTLLAVNLNRYMLKVLTFIKNYKIKAITSSIISDIFDSVFFVVVGLYFAGHFLPANSIVIEILFMSIAKMIISIVNITVLKFEH